MDYMPIFSGRRASRLLLRVSGRLCPRNMRVRKVTARRNDKTAATTVIPVGLPPTCARHTSKRQAVIREDLPGSSSDVLA